MRRPLNILELRSVRGTGGGPEKTILLGARRADPARYRVTVCYMRDARDETAERHQLGGVDLLRQLRELAGVAAHRNAWMSR